MDVIWFILRTAFIYFAGGAMVAVTITAIVHYVDEDLSDKLDKKFGKMILVCGVPMVIIYWIVSP